MSLKLAIAELSDEISALSKSPEGSGGWFLMQAKSFGLSLMRKATQAGIEEPVAFDRLRQRLRRGLMGDKSE